MTVSTTSNKVSFSANGSTTVFAYNFKIFADADLTVIIRAADGTETTKTLTTHYTVSGAGSSSGGNVTFTTGNTPANGETVVIKRELAVTQSTDYVANDPFPAASHEDALDRLTMIAQQQTEQIGRSIVFPDTDTAATTIPSSVTRANKFLGFGSSGEVAVLSSTGTSPGAIDTGNLVDSAVTSAKIADGTIQTADIADSQITSAKIADGAVATADIANDAVTADKIADDAVGSAQIADDAVGSAQIADDAVVQAAVADNAIGTNQIANAAVTNAKLSSDLQQGLCRAWVEFDATITPFVSATAVGDSFNITSINDAGTGIHDLSITNNMSNTGYAASGAAGENDDAGGNRRLGLRAKSTSAQNIRGFRDGVSAQDNQEMCVHIMGDLA